MNDNLLTGEAETDIKRTAQNMEILALGAYDRNQLRREQLYEHHISRKRR